KVRLHLPNLNARREDIPLVLRHLLRSFENEHRRAASDPAWSLSAESMRHLLIHHYTTNVRELELMLRNSVLGLRHADGQHGQPQGESSVAIDGDHASISAEQIRAALAKYDGVQERAWRALGLSSRHALGRLMRKYGIKS